MRRVVKVSLVSLLLLVTPALASGQEADPRPFVPVQDGFVSTTETVLPYAPDRVIVKFTPEAMRTAKLDLPLEKGATLPGPVTSLASLDAILNEAGVTRVFRPFIQPADKAAIAELGTDRWFQFDLPVGTDVPALAERLAADPHLEEALPDWKLFPAAIPNDPQYANNWGHNNTAQLPGFGWGTTWDHTGAPVGLLGFDTNAESAWDQSQGYGNTGIVIAILDSGVDVGHPDLNQVAGHDYGDGDSNPDDDSASPGHGTACAGVAAAIANNATGVTGIAGGCSIMPLKISNSAGSLYLSYSTNALYHAANNGADVASMSFGAALSSYGPMDTAIQYAHNQGVTLLAATGNENTTVISYPAINSYVIGVGAASPCGDRKRSSSLASECNPGVSTDPNGWTCDGERWWGSNYGTNLMDAAGAVDVLAPTILPTTDIAGSGGYQSGDYEPYFNGTSCSTPYAAGVCALIKAANPGWTPTQIRNRLTSSAQDIVNVESSAGWDRYSGHGMVDALAAVGGAVPTPPVANFTADATGGCIPMTVNFTDTSTGTITTWNWDFGDGNTSTAANPSHTYLVAGLFTVSLTVTGPVGSDVLTQIDHITVGQSPVVDFSATPISGQVPLTVDFTDLTTGDPTQWTWNFGDGGSDTVQNPSHIFTAAGTYSVTLVVQNSCGSGYISKPGYIAVAPPPPPVADFSADPTSGCLPLTVDFSDASTGDITDWDWDFGDGNVDNVQNPNHIYLGPGPYTVSLTVTGPGGSNAKTVTDMIVVGDVPFAAFSASDSSGTAPLTVEFTDLSGGDPTAWLWDFGDAATDTVQNPSHVYAVAGTYTVMLVATNSCGSDTLTSTDLISADPPAAPVAGFSGTPLTGCVPLDVAFSDTSTGLISTWAWDFGDSGTDSLQDPDHAYTVPGTFTVSLTVTGPGGSDTLTRTDYINIPGPVTASFSASDTTGTVPLTVDFTDLSTGDPAAWDWDFGDTGTSTAQNPSHTYTGAGAYTVTLIAGNACASDTTTLVITANAVSGPAAAFTGTPTGGCGPLSVDFTDESTGIIGSWLWEFGDATSDTSQNPTHVFDLPGAYDVRLMVFGPGGSDTLTVAGYVTVDSTLTAAFSASTTEGPNPLTVDFTDLSTGGATGWTWDFGDAAGDTNQNPSHTYTSEGTYTVTLTAVGGCSSDVVVKTDLIVVRSPSATGDGLPALFGMAPNFPNPFNPMTTIVFSLAGEGHARLEIFDATGRRLDTLVDRTLGEGEHRINWQPRNLASGVYFARLHAEGQLATRRLVLIK